MCSTWLAWCGPILATESLWACSRRLRSSVPWLARENAAPALPDRRFENYVSLLLHVLPLLPANLFIAPERFLLTFQPEHGSNRRAAKSVLHHLSGVGDHEPRIVPEG